MYSCHNTIFYQDFKILISDIFVFKLHVALQVLTQFSSHFSSLFLKEICTYYNQGILFKSDLKGTLSL